MAARGSASCLMLVALLRSTVCGPAGPCPAAVEAAPRLLPDSVYCSVYYECGFGDPVRHTCQGRRVFDKDSRSCVSPSSSTGCTSPTDSGARGETPAGPSTTHAPAGRHLVAPSGHEKTDGFRSTDEHASLTSPGLIGVHSPYGTLVSIADLPSSKSISQPVTESTWHGSAHVGVLHYASPKTLVHSSQDLISGMSPHSIREVATSESQQVVTGYSRTAREFVVAPYVSPTPAYKVYQDEPINTVPTKPTVVTHTQPTTMSRKNRGNNELSLISTFFSSPLNQFGNPNTKQFDSIPIKQENRSYVESLKYLSTYTSERVPQTSIETFIGFKNDVSRSSHKDSTRYFPWDESLPFRHYRTYTQYQDPSSVTNKEVVESTTPTILSSSHNEYFSTISPNSTPYHTNRNRIEHNINRATVTGNDKTLSTAGVSTEPPPEVENHEIAVNYASSQTPNILHYLTKLTLGFPKKTANSVSVESSTKQVTHLTPDTTIFPSQYTEQTVGGSLRKDGKKFPSTVPSHYSLQHAVTSTDHSMVDMESTDAQKKISLYFATQPVTDHLYKNVFSRKPSDLSLPSVTTIRNLPTNFSTKIPTKTFPLLSEQSTTFPNNSTSDSKVLLSQITPGISFRSNKFQRNQSHSQFTNLWSQNSSYFLALDHSSVTVGNSANLTVSNTSIHSKNFRNHTNFLSNTSQLKSSDLSLQFTISQRNQFTNGSVSSPSPIPSRTSVKSEFIHSTFVNDRFANVSSYSLMQFPKFSVRAPSSPSSLPNQSTKGSMHVPRQHTPHLLGKSTVSILSANISLKPPEISFWSINAPNKSVNSETTLRALTSTQTSLQSTTTISNKSPATSHVRRPAFFTVGPKLTNHIPDDGFVIDPSETPSDMLAQATQTANYQTVFNSVDLTTQNFPLVTSHMIITDDESATHNLPVYSQPVMSQDLTFLSETTVAQRISADSSTEAHLDKPTHPTQVSAPEVGNKMSKVSLSYTDFSSQRRISMPRQAKKYTQDVGWDFSLMQTPSIPYSGSTLQTPGLYQSYMPTDLRNAPSQASENMEANLEVVSYAGQRGDVWVASAVNMQVEPTTPVHRDIPAETRNTFTLMDNGVPMSKATTLSPTKFANDRHDALGSDEGNYPPKQEGNPYGVFNKISSIISGITSFGAKEKEEISHNTTEPLTGAPRDITSNIKPEKSISLKVKMENVSPIPQTHTSRYLNENISSPTLSYLQSAINSIITHISTLSKVIFHHEMPVKSDNVDTILVPRKFRKVVPSDSGMPTNSIVKSPLGTQSRLDSTSEMSLDDAINATNDQSTSGEESFETNKMHEASDGSNDTHGESGKDEISKQRRKGKETSEESEDSEDESNIHSEWHERRKKFDVQMEKQQEVLTSDVSEKKKLLSVLLNQWHTRNREFNGFTKHHNGQDTGEGSEDSGSRSDESSAEWSKQSRELKGRVMIRKETASSEESGEDSEDSDSSD